MTPKELYLANEDQKRWHTETFRTERGLRALHAVFADYSATLPNAVEGGAAISINARRFGAKEFMNALLEFTLEPKPTHIPDDGRLLDTTVRTGPTQPVNKPPR